MKSANSIVLAFLLAPLAGVTVTSFVLALLADIPLPGFLLAGSVIAYLTTLVLGVPTFLLTRPFQLQSLVSYVAIACCVGLVPAITLGYLLRDYLLAGSIAVGAAAAGLVFGVFVTRDLTMRSSGP